MIQPVDLAQRINAQSSPIRTMELPDINLFRAEAFEGPHKVLAEIFRLVSPLVFVHASADGRILFCVHDDAAVLPL